MAPHPELGTNIQAMQKGYAPIGPDGKPINLHHMTQHDEGALAEVTQSFHQKYYGVIHTYTKMPKEPVRGFTPVNRNKFDQWRNKIYWLERSKDFE